MTKKSIPNKLPKYLYRYFWDVDPKTVNPRKYSKYVINRLLNEGGPEAVRWVQRNFPKEIIIETLKTRRDFRLRIATYWAAFYNIDEREVKCLQEPYRTLRKTLWPY